MGGGAAGQGEEESESRLAATGKAPASPRSPERPAASVVGEVAGPAGSSGPGHYGGPAAFPGAAAPYSLSNLPNLMAQYGAQGGLAAAPPLQVRLAAADQQSEPADPSSFFASSLR